jgi:hypothetical protein
MAHLLLRQILSGQINATIPVHVHIDNYKFENPAVCIRLTCLIINVCTRTSFGRYLITPQVLGISEFFSYILSIIKILCACRNSCYFTWNTNLPLQNIQLDVDIYLHITYYSNWKYVKSEKIHFCSATFRDSSYYTVTTYCTGLKGKSSYFPVNINTAFYI